MLESLLTSCGADLMGLSSADAGAGLVLAGVLGSLRNYALIFLGFSLVIFFHELGHFLAAKACGVRVEKFAVGFGKEIFGFGWGETRYAFNILPLGGYVKMLGQEDFAVDKSGELAVKEDPRAFINKPVGQRMIIVSAGVIMNLVFAAVVFMLVFMIGMQSLPAEIGWLQPGSPAERVGLRVGDRIVEVNGEPISDQSDLRAAVILSNPDKPLDLVYERTDPETDQANREQVTLRPEKNSDLNVLQIGVAPPLDTTVGMIIAEPALPEDEQLQLGDEILEVNGEKVDHFYEFQFALAELKGQFADIKVRRDIAPDGAEEPEYVEKMVQWRARVLFLPGGRYGVESGHLLGLVPRLRVADVEPGKRAAQAGIKGGDVIVRWGNQLAPRIDEVMASVRENPEKEIPVMLLRYEGGSARRLEVAVRPQATGLFGQKRDPQLGFALQSQENDRLVIADIVTELKPGVPMPAAAVKELMPRGSLLTKVNGEPVETWDQLAQHFIDEAGGEVTLTWSYDGQPEESGTIAIPHTIGTTFPLPGARLITSIAGRSRVEVDMNGRRRAFSVNDWIGAGEMLKRNVGNTIEVVYWDQYEGKQYTEQLTVTEEMVDAWTLRVQYAVNDVITNLKRVLVQETNPVKAMMIGVRKTTYFIGQVYLTMRRMIFTRSMGLDQISGPVGIIKMGSDLAAAGLPVLMYFLALISANLAVINFLPLPIFDGGLFVFLIIEKIKGAPVSIKVQVATQVIGLALIIGIFLFVTFQDIAKLAGWG